MYRDERDALVREGKRGKRKMLNDTVCSCREKLLSHEMALKIDTDRGREIYPHRMKIVEPVFANIRTQKRLDRFTLKREGQGKHPVVTLLYGTQHRKDSELWPYVCGRIKEEG